MSCAAPARPDRAHGRREELGDYDLRESIAEPGVFCFYENWDSGDNVDAHLEAPRLTEFAARITQLLDETS